MNIRSRLRNPYVISLIVSIAAFVLTYFGLPQVASLFVLSSVFVGYFLGFTPALVLIGFTCLYFIVSPSFEKSRMILTLLNEFILVYFASRFKKLRERLERSLEQTRQSEERFKIKFKNSPIPIFSWQKIGDDFQLVDYNLAAEALTHYKIKSLLGRKASELYDSRPDVPATMREAFDKKGIVKGSSEFRLITTGERKYLDTSFVYVPPDLILIHTEDITERHKTEEELENKIKELNEAKEEAEKASAAKDHFLSVVSHELKTPLASIIGYATMVAEMNLTADEQKNALKVIERNAKTQASLINDLLDVSRFLTGSNKVKIKELIVGVAGIISQIYEVFKPIAQNKGVSLNLDIQDLNIFVKGDPEKLKQIFSNIVDNAIKFTSKGGRVDLIVKNDENSVIVEINDTGIGIPKSQIPHLFEIFHQGESFVTTRKFQGLGLGLYIVKNLVNLHHGTVEIQSEESKGTSVLIKFPLTSSPISEDIVVMHEHRKADAELILVVEDDDITREMLVIAFKKAGFSVVNADSAEKARKVLKNNPVTIIVSDVGLPVQSGLEFMAELRKTGYKIPSLALTAFEGAQYELESKKHGFDAYLSKPVDLNVLLKTVKNLI